MYNTKYLPSTLAADQYFQGSKVSSSCPVGTHGELGPAGGLFVPTGRTRTFGSVKTTSPFDSQAQLACQPGLVCPAPSSGPASETRVCHNGRNMLAALPPTWGSSPWITVNLASTDRGAIVRAQDCPPGLHEKSHLPPSDSSQAKVGLLGRPCGDHNLSIISWSHAVDEQSQLGLADTSYNAQPGPTSLVVQNLWSLA